MNPDRAVALGSMDHSALVLHALAVEQERYELVETLKIMTRWMQHGFMRDVDSDITVSDDSAIGIVRRALAKHAGGKP